MNSRHTKPKSAFGQGIFPESEDPTLDLDQAPDETDPADQDRSDPAPPRVREDFEHAAPEESGEPGGRQPSYRNQSYRTGKRESFVRRGTTPGALQKFGHVGKHGEPLCLAELLAQERSRGLVEPDYDEAYERLKQGGDETYLTELEKMSMQELVAEARKLSAGDLDVENDPDLSARHELLFRLLKNRVKQNGLMFGEGTLEVLPDQFGFLRSAEFHYLSSSDDIYISPSQIRRFGLRPGCIVSGQIRPPKENERYFALLRVEAINREDPFLLTSRPNFESLTPVYPNQQLLLSHPDAGFDMRLIDRLIPLGFGQRGLIAGPAKSGKTTLMRKMAAAALRNYPDLYVFVLLLDELPEEANEIAKNLKSARCEVVSSLFEEPPVRHVHLAEIVLEKAKRMVEYGKNVVLFLDSIKKLACAWSDEAFFEERAPAERQERLNLQPVKKYFSSARKAEEGGSLTIFASAPTGTGDELDEIVYNAFKGTGNMEILLDGELAEKRIWPAINIHRSGTRHEEFLLSEKDFQTGSALRRRLADMSTQDAIEFLRNDIEAKD